MRQTKAKYDRAVFLRNGNFTSHTFYFWIASSLCRFHEDLITV